MSRKRSKPASPEMIAMRRHDQLEREQRQRDVAALKAMDDVRVVTDHAGRIVAAQHLDVFALLLSRKALTLTQFEAARRLERDYAAAAMVDGGERLGSPVDGGTMIPGRVYRAIDARARVALALARVGPVNAVLLGALLGPQFEGKPVLWRTIVWKVTGESRPEVQAGVVRSACANLAESYAKLDYETNNPRSWSDTGGRWG